MMSVSAISAYFGLHTRATLTCEKRPLVLCQPITEMSIWTWTISGVDFGNRVVPKFARRQICLTKNGITKEQRSNLPLITMQLGGLCGFNMAAKFSKEICKMIVHTFLVNFYQLLGH